MIFNNKVEMMEVQSGGSTLSSRIRQFWSRFRARVSFKWAGVAVIILCTLGAYGMMGEPETKVAVLETGQVTRGNLERVLTATGIIKPEEGAEVKTGTRVTGVIEKLHVKLGDDVAKGQPIALMDKREHEAQYRKLEAELGTLRTELARLKETYPLRIEEATADLGKAKAEAELAEVSYDRIAELIKSKSVAEAELDQVQEGRTTTRQTQVMRETIKKRLEAEYDLEKTRLEFAINKAKAELDSAAIRLSYTTIVSPIDGVVSGITGQEGETVVAGLQVADLITVLDVSRLELRVYVDENDIGEVKIGDTVRFRVEAYPGKQFSGTVALIHPGPEIRNNIVYYRALVRLKPETARQLRPEMTAHCEMVVGEKEDILKVPNAAFKWVGARRILLALDAGGRPWPRKVRTGMVGRHHTEVLEGLEEDEEVITRVELPEDLPEEWEAAL